MGGFRGSQIQKYVEAVKRLDRLAPNLAHMCRFIWERIYSKQIALREGGGHFQGGFRGSNIQKCGESVKRLDRLAPILVHVCAVMRLRIHLEMDIGLIQVAPQYPMERFRGSHIQMYGEAVKRLDRLAPILVHVCGFVWEWT